MCKPNARARLQSAMEYLMTYGWSILLIAIVLAALYSLGIFSSTNFAPKVPPGSCHVLRPGGVGSTTNINLEGTCNNELPEYVAQFSTATNSYISTGTTGLPAGDSQRSIFMWVYPVTGASGGTMYSYGTYTTNNMLGFLVQSGSTNIYIQVIGDDWTGASQLNFNAWNFIGFIYSAGSSNTATLDINGNYYSHNFVTSLSTALPGSDPSDIGRMMNNQNTQYYKGLISNIQIYNTSLDLSSVNALYAEGIGGAPIALQNLVAWWPLNGDANDYSGDYNNGVPNSIVFTNSWENGYTTP